MRIIVTRLNDSKKAWSQPLFVSNIDQNHPVIDFPSCGNISYENGDYYLTIPQIEVGDIQGWVKWKMNWSNAAWEVVNAGLTPAVKGEFYANGRYVYNSQNGVLFLYYQNTTFLDCGPVKKGLDAYIVTSLDSTTMKWSSWYPGDDLRLTWTRSSGTSGDIVGTWSGTMGPNTYSATTNADGTFSVTGNIVQCGY